jgi:hypothetical protein
MAIDKNLIDQLLTDYKKPEDIIGENGLLKELTKAILERAVGAGKKGSHYRRSRPEPASPQHRVPSSSRGCVKSGNTALFAGFPSSVGKSAFGLFHGASFPQPSPPQVRFSCCALLVICIYP